MRLASRQNTGKQIIALLRYALFMIGCGLYFCGVVSRGYNYMLAGITVFFVSSLFFGFAEGRTRYVFLFFHLSIFTFLISRPLILYFQGEEWWKWYTQAATFTALNILFLSLLALRIGAWIGDGIEKRLEQNEERKKKRKAEEAVGFSDGILREEYRKAFLKNLGIVSLAFFGITIAASFAEGAEQLIFMGDRTYNEFFLNYQSSLPYAVITLGSMAKYAICIFLATMPKKRTAVIVLFIFWLDAVPSLVIGVRNPLILRVIFAIVYFIMRDAAGSEEKWIGLKEKAALIIGSPAAVALLGVYASIRLGKSAEGGFGYYLVRFFYNQGVTFDTVRSVVRAIPKLPAVVPKNYTFGSFIDYVLYGSLGQKLFGTPNIGNTNSAIKAIYGNNLAHSSYYVINENRYLAGWGKGSSYMLENYVDGGYPGVIAFGLALGILLILLTYWMKHNNTLVRTIAMVSLLGLFFSPRAEAAGWIAFVIYFQFWVLVITVYLIAGLCVKKYTFRSAGMPVPHSES